VAGYLWASTRKPLTVRLLADGPHVTVIVLVVPRAENRALHLSGFSDHESDWYRDSAIELDGEQARSQYLFEWRVPPGRLDVYAAIVSADGSLLATAQSSMYVR
jgi:hypothetical protein